MGQRYWIVGGEYADCAFKQLGQELQRVGREDLLRSPDVTGSGGDTRPVQHRAHRTSGSTQME